MLQTDDRLAYHIPEAARLINRSELATRRLIDRGKLPARRWGRRVVVLREDLEEFLRALPARPIDGSAV